MAKPTKIRSEVDSTWAQINELHGKIRDLQRKCKHDPKFIRERYQGNTGNYDPSQDCYWVDRTCTNCGSHWSINSEEEGYRSIIPFDKQKRSDDGTYTHKDAP